MSRQISQSPTLTVIANIFGTIFIGFGINAILNPSNALTFFELPFPTSAFDRKVVEDLLIVYGVRDVFMGLAIYAAALLGEKRTLGWIVLAASTVAIADGMVCYKEGKGEWNHWGYAPIVSVVGGLLTGVLDA